MLELNSTSNLAFNKNEFKRVYITLLVVGFIYALPVILLDRYYVDDLGRSIFGYAGWAVVARPLANIITGSLSFQYPTTDIHLIDSSPLFQILSIAVLAFAATILFLNIRSSKGKPSFFDIMLVFPIIGSPYLLQNLSYKFDSISMTLALSLSIISAITLTNRILNIIIGSLLISFAFGLYQASVNAFIGVTCVLFIAEYISSRSPNYKLLLDNIFKLVLGSLIYRLYLALNYIRFVDYTYEHSISISLDAHGLNQFLANLTEFTKIIYDLFIQIPILSCLAILSVFMLLIRAIVYSTQYRSFNRFILVSIFILCILIIALSVFGFSLFLLKPVYEPRVLLGFTIFLVFLLYSYNIAAERFWAIGKYLIIIPIFYMFFIAYGYAAASRGQFNYDNYLVSSIIRDLRASGMLDNDFLLLDGVQPKSPVLKNSSQIKVLERLVPIYINNDFLFGYILMNHFGLIFRRLPTTYIASKEMLCSGDPIISTPEYKIFKYEATYLVSFEGGECFGAKSRPDLKMPIF